MKYIALLALAALAGCYTDEGSGQVALKTFPVEGFTEVVLSGDGQATVVPGDYAVTASADSDLLATVRAEQRGNRLILSREVDWIDGIRPTLPIDYRVSMPTLAVAEATGSGVLKVRDMSADAELRLAVFGAGTIDATGVAASRIVVEVEGAGVVSASGVEADALQVEIVGAGQVTADGRVAHAKVAMVGAGVFRGSHLQAGSAAVEVTGAGQALVWAVERLEAQVHGIGRVAYVGEPAVEEVIQGEGEVVAAR